MGWKKVIAAAHVVRNPFAKSSSGVKVFALTAGCAVVVCAAVVVVGSKSAVPAAASSSVQISTAVPVPAPVQKDDLPSVPLDHVEQSVPVTPAPAPGEKLVPASTTVKVDKSTITEKGAAETKGIAASPAKGPAPTGNPTPAPAPVDEAPELIQQAQREFDAADGNMQGLERARTLFQQALESGRLDAAGEAQCVEKLLALTDKLILNPKAACLHPKAVFHTVEQGDVVERIAKRYKVNKGQVKLINRLNDKLAIRYGQALKMLPGDVLYKVDRTRLTGTLYIDGVFIRRYPVGIGPGNATPPGTYTIENKVTKPDWYYDNKKYPYGDPANILGTRWMGFEMSAASRNGAGLGIHGTTQPQSVPGRESKGCVRMHNEDVEELYELMPQGGKVVILQ